MGAEARTVTFDTAAAIAQWCGGRLVVQVDSIDCDVTVPAINVPCRDEVKRAQVGSIVIKHHDGTFDVMN